MDDVAKQWAGDPPVTEMTDTDLTASRRDNSNVSDPSRELHRLAETVYDSNEYDYKDISWMLDTALRIELARLIDGDRVSFGREDFDVKFTIPQEGWVSQQAFEPLEIVDEDTFDARGLNFSTAPVVLAMAERVVYEGVYDSVSQTVKAGLKVLAGQ